MHIQKESLHVLVFILSFRKCISGVLTVISVWNASVNVFIECFRIILIEYFRAWRERMLDFNYVISLIMISGDWVGMPTSICGHWLQERFRVFSMWPIVRYSSMRCCKPGFLKKRAKFVFPKVLPDKSKRIPRYS